MKKLLLASTALVMTAGVAAAEVTTGGTARMGLVYDGDDVVFNSRIRIIFTASGETDTGIAFGGTIRADNASAGNQGRAGNVFISGAFGRLAMGDVDGAALAAVGDLRFNSLTGLGDPNEMTYLSRISADPFGTLNTNLGFAPGEDFDGDNVFGILPRALYTFTIDDLSLFVSIGNPVVNRDDDGARESSIQEVAVGAQYTFAGFTGGIGYEDTRIKVTGEDTTTGKHFVGSVAYTIQGVELKAIAGRLGGDLGTIFSENDNATRNQWGLSARTTIEDVTVSAFYNNGFFRESFGAGASYSLGGGAAVTGGIVRRSSNNLVGSETQADFGLTFTF